MAASDRARVESFLSALQARLSAEVGTWRWGTSYLHPPLPKVWDLNLLRIDGDAPEATAEAVAGAAEEVMGGVAAYRRVWVPDGSTGERLAPGFEDLGWETDVHVVMVHRRPPNRIVDTSEVEEVGDLAWPARVEQLCSYEWHEDDVIDQLRRLYDMTVKAASMRDFGIRRDGKAISFAMLLSDGRTGQIEDVATLEPYRAQGLSWAVMSRVIAESRALYDLTFLVADDRDWPKGFYRKLGFDPLARHYYFLKRPST